MLGVGAINIICACLLAVGVSYFAATVLEEFYSYEQVRFNHSVALVYFEKTRKYGKIARLGNRAPKGVR